MGPPTKDTRLPQSLLARLGVSAETQPISCNHNIRVASRKEQRKGARELKRSSHVPRDRILSRSVRDSNQNKENKRQKSNIDVQPSKVEPTFSKSKTPKTIHKHAHSPLPRKESKDKTSLPSFSSRSLSRVPRNVEKDLSADDAEIAALEKALGMKGKKKLPKSFEHDGLDTLMESIDDVANIIQIPTNKRRKSEESQLLENKRQKTQDRISRIYSSDDSNDTSDDGESSQSSFEDEELKSDKTPDEFYKSASADEGPNQQLSNATGKRTRENPYIAPPASDHINDVKPSQRNSSVTKTQDLSLLRRQILGLLNRLSEANLLSILTKIESLYQNYPRQHVSTTLLDLIVSTVSSLAVLSDTYMILHAGFIAAVYKVIGAEIGAQVIQRVDEQFIQCRAVESDFEDSGKKLTNLSNLLAELYNFQVLGSHFMYDLIRSCLEKTSETNTELLLHIIRNAGPQLRQDDPSSLREIVHQLQSSVIEAGEEGLPARMKFMIETINDLKNNRTRNMGNVATTIASEHRIRMKKILGSLNSRSIKASEPLRVTMKDIRGKDKVGMWWLVGASYKGDVQGDEYKNERFNGLPAHGKGSSAEDTDRFASDLVQLAREQRMNTDVRRSIFVAVMSSSDYHDAYVRLKKLRLKRSQELEMPKVVLQCAGTEKAYNPFYAFLSRRICSDKKLKMSFQFALWDLFKQMGEGNEESHGDHGGERQEKPELRSLVNIAKLYGVLIAEDGLGLDVLKNLNFAFLQPESQMFLEVLLITAVLHCQHLSKGARDEKTLLTMFLKSKEISTIAGGLRYFLKKVVRKTDIAGSHSDKATVTWACEVACDALAAFTTRSVIEG